MGEEGTGGLGVGMQCEREVTAASERSPGSCLVIVCARERERGALDGELTVCCVGFCWRNDPASLFLSLSLFHLFAWGGSVGLLAWKLSHGFRHG